MFNDVVIGGAHFRSKTIKENVSVSCWTDPLSFNENHCQTQSDVNEIGVQSELTLSDKNEKKKKVKKLDQIDEKLSDFVKYVGSLMLEALQHSIHTAPFFKELERFQERTIEKQEITNWVTLRFDYEAYFSKQNDLNIPKASQATSASLKLSCTGVSWNATGSVIAVSYGRFDHTGWCNYRGALCIWNVFAKDFEPSKPALIFETPSGLMCTAYHPKKPSVIAAGLFTGEVNVWDTEPQEYRLYSTGISEYAHKEPVTKVCWVYDPQSSDYQIASVSGDGRILFWRVNDKRLEFPLSGYCMYPEKTSLSNTELETIGIKSIGFSNDRNTKTFVIGSDAGTLTRCFGAKTATLSRTRLGELFKGDKKWTVTACRLVGNLPTDQLQVARRFVEKHASGLGLKEVTLNTVYESRMYPTLLYPSAMDFRFTPHNGSVFDVAFSPFRSTLFLTSSSDGTVRMYNHSYKEPIFALDVTPAVSYLYAIQWSKTRPTVFAVSAEDGCVYVFDMQVDQISPIAVLNASAKGCMKTGRAMLCLDFNPQQRNFLAAGDASGNVFIYKLPWALSNFQTGEMSILDSLETSTNALF